MKRFIYILAFVATATTVSAQTEFGIKAGFNYADNGEIEYSDFENAGKSAITGGDGKAGYHLGVYLKGDLGGFFLRPELLYTRTESSYEYNNEEADYSLSKLDLPVLVGLNLLGPVHIFAGPSFQYIVQTDFDGITLEDVENDFTIGAQFGAGLEFGGFGIDVRYERALTKNEAQVIQFENLNGLERVDTRPSQIIFALSIDL